MSFGGLKSAMGWVVRYYWLGIALVLVVGAAWRFVLPLVPASDPDTWGYLNPALHFLTEGKFVHTCGREYPYPLFLFLILRVCGDFNWITIVQHLAGLATGILLLRTWHRLAGLFPATDLQFRAHRLLGLILFAVMLLSGSPIQTELCLRPEAMFQFASAVTLLLALEYYIAFFRKQQLLTAFVLGVALVFSGCLLFFLRPSFGLAVGAVAFPVLASVFSSKSGMTYKCGILLTPALLVWLVLVRPESALVGKYDPNSVTFLRTHLFCFNARCVRSQIAAELNASEPLPFERPLLEKVLSLIDTELSAKKPGAYKSLGYDPDRMMYGDSVVNFLYGRFADDPAARNRFYMHYYLRAWMHQPVPMAGKILTQLGLFYSGLDAPLGGAVTVKARSLAERNLQSVAPFPLPCGPLADYVKNSSTLQASKKSWRVGVAASVLAMTLRALYPIVFLSSCVYGAFLWLNRRRIDAGNATLKVPAICTLYLFSYNFLHVLTISVIHSVQLSRYLKCQLVYTLLAEGAGILLCIALWELRKKDGALSGLRSVKAR